MFQMDPLFILFLMVGYVVSHCDKQVICIHGNSSNTGGAISQDGKGKCSVTVAELSDSLMRTVTNCTTLLFTKRKATLDMNFSLHNLSNITLASERPDGTAIHCTSTESRAGSIGSGLTFVAVQNLVINGVTLKGCGVLHNYSTVTITRKHGFLQFRSAVYMSRCENVCITGSNIIRSNGRAISLFDTRGNLTISDSKFSLNKMKANEKNIHFGGGGIYIEITQCGVLWTSIKKCPPSRFPNVTDAKYLIKSCNFSENVFTNQVNEHVFEQGGGAIGIVFKGNAAENVIIIKNITAVHNQVHFGYGGGLFSKFRDSTHKNNLTVMNSNFLYNRANPGGGGVDAGYDFHIKNYVSDFPRDNVMRFSNLLIEGNNASFGGGGAFFSGPSPIPLSNSFIFSKCVWFQNSGTFGSALMVSPKLFGAPTSVYTPLVAFSECNFTQNKVTNLIFSNHSSSATLNQETEGIGTVYIRSFTIELRGRNWFDFNEGSAIYALSSVIRVPAEGHANFSNNAMCSFGGAIRLIGPSSIQLGNNSHLYFINNSASSSGGAIYVYNTDKGASKTFGVCFIQYIDFVPQMGKISAYIQFNGNKLTSSQTSRGSSVFVSSLLPCTRLCEEKVKPKDSLDCIANISFVDQENSSTAFATEGSYFRKTKNISNPEMVVPGKRYVLPIEMIDEIGSTVNTPLLRVTVSNDSVKLEQPYTIDKSMKFYGKPGTIARVKFQTIQYHNVSFSITIKLSECPPGFVSYKDTGSCNCSLYNDSNNYNGIFACDQTDFQAHLQIGYWIGYMNKSNAIEGEGAPEYLVVGTCPLGFCVGSNETYITLPATPNGISLNHKICEKNRKGILCGECIDNHSVFFHSFTFRCGPNDLCQYGVIFYLLSEILPLTVIFCVTILFHVNFTSGYLNGFILFAQILDSLSLEANGGVLITSKPQKAMLHAIHLIYSPFNLDLFRVEGLDFCLFKGANFLQIVSIGFVSLVYSLVLVLVLVMLMKCNFCYKLQLVCLRMRITNSSSLLNGLSAFLILCYSQCCRICFSILNIAWLQGQGFWYVNPPRVFRMGSLTYTNTAYVGYACLAGVFMTVFVIIPPLLLILQPLSHRFLPARFFERGGRLRAVCIHFDLLHPLFDTLQGCFKDKFRYFAGLYLIYRLLPSAVFTLMNSRLAVFTLTQVILILMLGLHYWAKPYRRSIHNNIDTAIFLNLLLINSFTIYRYFLTQSTTAKYALTGGTYIQLTFVYLPAVFLLLFSLARLIHRLWQRKIRTNDSLPDLILSENDRFGLNKRFLYDSLASTSSSL